MKAFLSDKHNLVKKLNEEGFKLGQELKEIVNTVKNIQNANRKENISSFFNDSEVKNLVERRRD